MIYIILYIILVLAKSTIKNCKTILINGNQYFPAAVISGVNALMAVNLIKITVEFDIVTVSIVACMANFVGCILAMKICKTIKKNRNYENRKENYT